MSINKFKTLAALTLLASSVVEAENIERQFEADPGDRLYLKTDAGSIDIDTHNRDEITVDVEISGRNADDFEVTFDETSKGLEIRGERDSANGWNNLKVKFYVTVPKEYDVELMTAGGSIKIDDLIGNIDANTSGGSISIGDIEGDVNLHTSGGSIKTDAITGEIDAHTSGGSINVTFATQPKDDASLTTSGGSITAKLPADIQVDLDATTSGGRVRSEFDVDGRVKKQSIRGEINGGGPRLKLHTSGGSVRVEKN